MQEEFDPIYYELVSYNICWESFERRLAKVYGDERDWCDPKNANSGKRIGVILERPWEARRIGVILERPWEARRIVVILKRLLVARRISIFIHFG